MPRITVPSYAKLNLYLKIEGVRPDGYHEIDSLFERVSLHDTLRFSPSRDGAIHIRCSTPGIPLDGNNLCHKAALALKTRYKVSSGCVISLQKRIPAGAGMGGGSSNAAATLKGLCRLWRLRPSRKALMELAARVGSDVPFFCLDVPYARVRGRGERLNALPEGMPKLFHVICVPPVQAATKKVYSQWDSARLTSICGDVTMIFSALRRRDLRALSARLCNDLERVAGKAYPAIPETKRQLSRDPGATGTLMTGSGSAVFGIFTSRTSAVSCARRLSRSGIRAFFAETR